MKNVTTHAKKKQHYRNTKHAEQQCKVCSKKWSSNIELFHHIKKEHSSKTENNVKNTESQDGTMCISKTEHKVSSFVSDEAQIYCELCIIKCKSKKALETHMNSFH